MADYVATSTSTSSLHLSPNRKRTREPHSARSSNSQSSFINPTDIISNIELVGTPETPSTTLPSITQPRTSIHVQNGFSSVKYNMESDGNDVSSNNVQIPIIVSSLKLIYMKYSLD